MIFTLHQHLLFVDNPLFSLVSHPGEEVFDETGSPHFFLFSQTHRDYMGVHDIVARFNVLSGVSEIFFAKNDVY
jgi:hypothetical protein